MKPGFGQTPFALDGSWRPLQHERRFIHGKPGEISELDEPDLIGVDARESLQRVVHVDDVGDDLALPFVLGLT